ncbi:hypothetical protein [Flavobacterium hydrophilum]|uniref:Uncharacterized protein n=1 Tax=Flavobacterium hydrophilum TaxID=2211445 RepID=A0A2V4BZK9_9FLAO|nr:hypothetical protein [Flavobacterium hydrophilum]PXY44506.1 hypothetical protein DMB68_13645 [Flavobacterium hydrophilum]
MLTDLEIEKIQSIYFHISPNALRPIQQYDEMRKIRTDTIVGYRSKKQGFWDVIYMDIENITPWQLKTFDKRVKKDLPGRSEIEKHGDVTRLIFK